MESKESMHLKAQEELKNSEINSELSIENEANENEVSPIGDKSESMLDTDDLEVKIDEVEETQLEVVESPEVTEVEEIQLEVAEVVEALPDVAEEVIEEVEEVQPEVAEEVIEVVEEAQPEVAEVVIKEVEEAQPEVAEVQPEVVELELEAPLLIEDLIDEDELIEAALEIDDLEVNDYSEYNDVELINELRELVAKDDSEITYPHIEAIKVAFFKRLKARQQEQLDKFVEAGGIAEEFVPAEDDYEEEFKNYIKQYRAQRADKIKVLEHQKEENVTIKYEIIEEIKHLVNRTESINKTFQDFRDLQQKWHDTGLVPQAKMKDLWETYHHHVENFYDYIKINKELRDLDLKKNIEAKIILCEKAEELLMESSVLKAFNMLQKFHEQWREVGPVPRDKKDELWERFKEATTMINKKHQEFFESRKKTQKTNLDAKTALCEKVEEILEGSYDTHKDWEDKSAELVELQKYWRTIGFAPKKDNNKIYERFREACDKFFDRKREFYTSHKEVQNNNMQLKVDLCTQAESLKESADWKKTTDELISIQKKWKEIGPIPRKQSDQLWKRFRAACDFFFERKSEFFSSKDVEQIDNLNLKKALIEEVRGYVQVGDDNADFEKLKELQRRWTEIGHVPIKEKDTIQKEFRELINKQFDTIRAEDRGRNIMKFKSKMSDLGSNGRGSNKIRAERDKYVIKLKQIESDLTTLKNNIGFFAKSKNADELIKDIHQKIERNEEQIIYLKEKIRVIDDVDNGND